MSELKLDIGCGLNKKEGFLGCDLRSHKDIDFTFNFEKDVWPFEDGSVTEILSHHTFEHIEDIISVMNEMWRVMKWESKATIIVPHKDCELAWQDPTHKRFWVKEGMKHFCGSYLKKYKLDYGINSCFKLLKNEVTVPDGRDDYFKQIEFVLEKSEQHFIEVDYDLLNDRNKKSGIKTEFSTEEKFIKLQSQMLEIFRVKNSNYGDGLVNSTIENAMFNIDRKYKRLLHFSNNKMIKSDETVVDTLLDLANYSLLMAILLERKGV